MYSNKTVSELKEICRVNKIKISGNKPDLINRITTHFTQKSAVIKIQRAYRKHLINRFNNAKGEHYRKKCINETDFYSFDDIITIPYEQFFACDDIGGHVYGWDISSLWNLICRAQTLPNNPYTCLPFHEKLYTNIRQFMHLSGILKLNTNYLIDVDSSYINTFESKLLSVFQHINSLGNYSNHSWILELNEFQLRKFLSELHDIWTYRAGIANEVKQLICHHNPFVISSIGNASLSTVRENVLNTIVNFVYKGINDEYKKLGAMYVLTALTIVSHNAATALPWLYASTLS